MGDGCCKMREFSGSYFSLGPAMNVPPWAHTDNSKEYQPPFSDLEEGMKSHFTGFQLKQCYLPSSESNGHHPV